MATPPRPPSLFDRVDIYWPTCERYFRGTLVRAVRPTSFTFFIHYDDNDYLRTNLNKVRWHYVTTSCCSGDQDVLVTNDFLPGDMQRSFGGTKAACVHVAVGRVQKKRRVKGRKRRLEFRGEAASGVSDVTFEQAETRSELEVSNRRDKGFDCEYKAVENGVPKWGNGGKQDEKRISETGYRCGTENQDRGDGGKGGERDGRVHWKKLMLAGYQNNGRS